MRPAWFGQSYARQQPGKRSPILAFSRQEESCEHVNRSPATHVSSNQMKQVLSSPTSGISPHDRGSERDRILSIPLHGALQLDDLRTNFFQTRVEAQGTSK